MTRTSIVNKKVLIGLVLLLSVSISLIAQAPRGELVRQVDNLLQKEITSGLLSGAVIQINHRGKSIMCRAYGYAEQYDLQHRPLVKPVVMTVDHMFDLASLTKVVATTTGIMYLVDQKKLDIDDAVAQYLPAFNSAEKGGITLRHLLTHTAGLREWYPMYYQASQRHGVYELIGRLPLKYEVGQERHYSDLGFTILGQIIELVSGQPLEQFVQEKVCGPLQMKNTVYNPRQTRPYQSYVSTSFGNPYEKRMVYDSTLGFTIPDLDPASWNGWRNYVLAGEVNDGNAWYAGQGVSGAAGLFSTVDDLQKFMDALLHAEKYNFITPSTVKRFLTQDSYKNGLGWMMDPSSSFMRQAPPGTFGHTGFTGTSVIGIPSTDLSLILLTNRQHHGLNDKMEYHNVGPLREKIFNAVLTYLKHQNQ